MTPVIRTVTFNTGFDDHFHVSDLRWGHVDRVHHYQSVPSGKGVNAARRVVEGGFAAHAYYLVGEADEAEFAASLTGCGVTTHGVPVAASTRHNLTVWTDDERIAAHMVGPGFDLTSVDAPQRLLDAVASESRPGDVVMLSGSVPQTLEPERLTDTVRRVTAAGARVLADLQNDYLLAAIRSGLLMATKPNEEEAEVLAELLSDQPSEAESRPDEAVAQASCLRAMADHGVALPLITLGGRGVLFLDEGAISRGVCTVARPRVVVGAGDSFMAGLASALITGRMGRDAVRMATAWAAAHVAGVPADEFADAAHSFSAAFQWSQI